MHPWPLISQDYLSLYIPFVSKFSHTFSGNMRFKGRKTLLSIFVSVVLLASFSFFLSQDAVNDNNDDSPMNPTRSNSDNPRYRLNYAIQEDNSNRRSVRHVSSIKDSRPTVSILFTDWEILVVVSPENSLAFNSVDGYYCLFQTNQTSPARFAGVLPFTNQPMFKCLMPNRVRNVRPFYMPILTKSDEKLPEFVLPAPEMMRLNFLAYESLSTETDVVLFVKGVNNRQGINLPPESLRCVFGDGINNAVKTAVISSSQEVFRCRHPEIAAEENFSNDRIKISLEITEENRVVPSVAYYTPPPRTLAIREAKSHICACTMVYNVAKFLREWVIYHANIGVEKFILYDNDSDDELGEVVNKLKEEGYDVNTIFWVWPKTQEAGFSHAAIYAKESCTWMMYVDVDEFVFSPSWNKSSAPSSEMLNYFLHKPSSWNRPIGQVSISCNEFGPSNQKSHPISGVTQGYTCRRRVEQRHKSIVLLEAVDLSLLNVIHHFRLKEDYRGKRLNTGVAVVNHYKYQAWSEFKAKFRRRVSAYVIDWTKNVNPMSKDRTPGLGFAPIEPEGWADKFCEVEDNRLKMLTQRWFGFDLPSGYRMAWQR